MALFTLLDPVQISSTLIVSYLDNDDVLILESISSPGSDSEYPDINLNQEQSLRLLFLLKSPPSRILKKRLLRTGIRIACVHSYRDALIRVPADLKASLRSIFVDPKHIEPDIIQDMLEILLRAQQSGVCICTEFHKHSELLHSPLMDSVTEFHELTVSQVSDYKGYAVCMDHHFEKIRSIVFHCLTTEIFEIFKRNLENNCNRPRIHFFLDATSLALQGCPESYKSLVQLADRVSIQAVGDSSCQMIQRFLEELPDKVNITKLSFYHVLHSENVKSLLSAIETKSRYFEGILMDYSFCHMSLDQQLTNTEIVVNPKQLRNLVVSSQAEFDFMSISNCINLESASFFGCKSVTSSGSMKVFRRLERLEFAFTSDIQLGQLPMSLSSIGLKRSGKKTMRIGFVDSYKISIDYNNSGTIGFTENVKRVCLKSHLDSSILEDDGPFFFESFSIESLKDLSTLDIFNDQKFPFLKSLKTTFCPEHESKDNSNEYVISLLQRMPKLGFLSFHVFYGQPDMTARIKDFIPDIVISRFENLIEIQR
jgi:hypothetical protein